MLGNFVISKPLQKTIKQVAIWSITEVVLFRSDYRLFWELFLDYFVKQIHLSGTLMEKIRISHRTPSKSILTKQKYNMCLK